jgi:hypothetical protein
MPRIASASAWSQQVPCLRSAVGLSHISHRLVKTAPDYGDLAGHHADPDLRIWMQADWSDVLH